MGRKFYSVDGTLDKWFKSLKRHALLMAQIVYVMPDGRLYRKYRKGQMPSGDAFTTVWNSLVLRLCAKLAGSVEEMNLGDDAILWFNGQYDVHAIIAKFAEIGLQVRGLERCCEDRFEFCSHEYWCEDGEWKASLVSWVKCVYGLLAGPTTAEKLVGTGSAMRHNSVKERLARVEAVLAKLLQ
jgi:hypothetical protein